MKIAYFDLNEGPLFEDYAYDPKIMAVAELLRLVYWKNFLIFIYTDILTALKM